MLRIGWNNLVRRDLLIRALTTLEALGAASSLSPGLHRMHEQGPIKSQEHAPCPVSSPSFEVGRSRLLVHGASENWSLFRSHSIAVRPNETKSTAMPSGPKRTCHQGLKAGFRYGPHPGRTLGPHCIQAMGLRNQLGRHSRRAKRLTVSIALGSGPFYDLHKLCMPAYSLQKLQIKYLKSCCMDCRREIDGLRTVAVLPVILFHAGVSVFSGGFLGVDVFFVISGYLITGIILPELSS